MIALQGCWANELLEQSGPQPGWVTTSKEMMVENRDGGRVRLYRAVVERARDLSLAKREARYELVKAIASEVSEDVVASFQSAKAASSNTVDRSDSIGGAIRDAISAKAQVRMANLAVEEVYWERRNYKTDAGHVEGYRVHILGSLPEEDLRKLKVEALNVGREKARAANDETSVKVLEEQAKQLEGK